MPSIDLINLSQVFFEQSEYLVFWFRDKKPQKIEVILAKDLLYSEDYSSSIVENDQPWLDASSIEFDLYKRELFHNNTRIYGVRWFEVINGSARVLNMKHNTPFREYLFSLLTFGIGGCCLINKKNKTLFSLYEQLCRDNEALLALNAEVNKSSKETVVLDNTFSLVNSNMQRLIDVYGSIDNIERKLEEWGVFRDVLKDEELKQVMLWKKEWGSIERIQRALQDRKSLGEGTDNLALANEWLEKYRSFYVIEEKLHKFQELSNEINLYKSHLSLGEVKEIVSLKHNYGDLERIKSLLHSAQECDNLRKEIERLKNREEKWKELAQGKDLEYMLKCKSTKDTENPLEEGRKLEERILDHLQSFRNRNMDDFVYEAEGTGFSLDKKNRRVDFYFRFTNKNHQYFHVVVECKSSKQWNELENFGYVNQNEEEQLKKGVEQICQYYEDKGANLGVVVINSNLFELRDKGMIRVPFQYIPKSYQHKHMDLCIVHENYFSVLLESIGFINKNYHPITPLSPEDNKEICESFWADEFLKLQNKFKEEQTKFEHLSNRVQDSYDAARKAQNYISNLKTSRDHTWNYLLDITTRIEYHSDKHLLETTTPVQASEVVEEE